MDKISFLQFIRVREKQEPRGYIRCDYFIVTYLIIVCDVI